MERESDIFRVSRSNQEFSIWLGSMVAPLTKSVASSQQSSAGWMPESMGKWHVGCRHPVTMCNASFKTLSMRQV